MPLTRQIAVGSHDVYVFDAEVEADTTKELYFEFAHERRYSRSEAATSENIAIKHWVSELELGEFAASPLGRRTVELVDQFYPGEKQQLFRAYCNLNSHGDALGVHRDCAPSERDVTVLWFVCDDWALDWRGELVLFDEDGDAQVAISPKPGRLCMFRGGLLHAGSPPSRFCKKPRLTLACKLAPAGEVKEQAPVGPDPFVSAEEVFEHMRRRLNRLPARDFEASYRFIVEGPSGGVWRVELTRNGGRVSKEDRAADLTIRVHVDSLLGIMNREIGVARAFVMRKIRAKGNIDLGVHLRAVIGPPGKEPQ